MGNTIDQTCQFLATDARSEQFLKKLIAMPEWDQKGIPMPIPTLEEYAEDIDPSKVLSLESSNPLKKAVDVAKDRANHIPEDLQLGVFVHSAENDPIFVPSKGYIEYLKEYQWLKTTEDWRDYDESKKSWLVIFTSNWSPVFDYFRFLGLMGIDMTVDWFEEFHDAAGEFHYKGHEIVRQEHDGEEALIYLIKKDWEIETFPRLTLDEHDSFTKFSQNTQLTNPELIALVKAYYDNKN